MTIRSSRRRQRAAWCAFAVIATIQIGIPAWLLTQPRPQRFGWQMYSTVLPVPSLIAIDATGTEIPMPYTEFLAFPRADLPADAWEGLPAHACSVVPDVVTVRYKLHDDAPWEEEPCNAMPDDEVVTPDLEAPAGSLPPARSA